MAAFAAANAVLHLSVHKDWHALLQFLFLKFYFTIFLLTLNLQLDRCCTSGILNERVPVQNAQFSTLPFHNTENCFLDWLLDPPSADRGLTLFQPADLISQM